MAKEKPTIIAWTVWTLAAIFFFYEFVIRVAPSVMVDDLMQSFSIQAALVGHLSAFYLYAYSPMQLPVGMLTDRFGAKRLLTLAALACAFGCALFSFADTFLMAALGRLLMGFGSSFGFVALVFISSHWFPPKKTAFLVGMGNSIGMLGATFGQGPTHILTEQLSWRGTYLIYALFGLILSLVIYLLVKRVKRKGPKKKPPPFFHYLKLVAVNPQSWINGTACFFFYATTVAFAALWGVPFLIHVHGLSEQVAAFGLSMIYVGWIVGGPIVGRLSDKMGQRKPFILIFSLLGLITLSPVIYFEHLQPVLIYFLLFFVGLFSSAEILHFTAAIEINIPAVKGTAVAFTNFITMIGGALLQPIIGLILDWHWDGTKLDGIAIYSASDWKVAMTIFPLSFFLCFLCALFLDERRYNKSAEVSF